MSKTNALFRRPVVLAALVTLLASGLAGGWTWYLLQARSAETGPDTLDPRRHPRRPRFRSSWSVLGDRQARIRGYYRTEDEPTLKRLRRDIRTLLSER